jgi:hypothetical protein
MAALFRFDGRAIPLSLTFEICAGMRRGASADPQGFAREGFGRKNLQHGQSSQYPH